MSDKIYNEYGKTGHKFPRTTKEAFGPNACVFVSTESEDEEVAEHVKLSIIFALVFYTLLAILIGFILCR